MSLPAYTFKRAAYRLQPFHRCVYCTHYLSFEEATVDHIRPKYNGGKDKRSNFAIACGRCNAQKALFSLHQYFRYRARRQQWFCKRSVNAVNKLLRNALEAQAKSFVATNTLTNGSLSKDETRKHSLPPCGNSMPSSISR